MKQGLLRLALSHSVMELLGVMSDEDRGSFSFANWSGAATGGVSRQSYKQKVAQVMIGRTRA
jgi:hypothetical protein